MDAKKHKQENELAPCSLQELRVKIDAADTAIAKQLDDRAAISLAVGKTKKLVASKCSYVAFREKQVLEGIAEKTPAKHLPLVRLQGIYKEILSASRSLQQQENIGVWQHTALLSARERFGGAAQYSVYSTVPMLLRHVATGQCSLGVISSLLLGKGQSWQVLTALHKQGIYIVDSCQQVAVRHNDKLQPQADNLGVPHYLCLGNFLPPATLPYVAVFAVQTNTEGLEQAVSMLKQNGYTKVTIASLGSVLKRYPLRKRYALFAYSGQQNTMCEYSDVQQQATQLQAHCMVALALGYYPQ